MTQQVNPGWCTFTVFSEKKSLCTVRLICLSVEHEFSMDTAILLFITCSAQTGDSMSAAQLRVGSVRKCSWGPRQNWRACPQFSSFMWTKWVKLGCRSPNRGRHSHGDDILVTPNCFPWCVVIVWPREGIGSQDDVCIPSTIHMSEYTVDVGPYSSWGALFISPDYSPWYIGLMISGLNREHYWFFHLLNPPNEFSRSQYKINLRAMLLMVFPNGL